MALTAHKKGSSPLTRGKHCEEVPDRLGAGIIPAHAGKTPPTKNSDNPSWDHPRSRGENGVKSVSLSLRLGSSPLTRGKLPQAIILATRTGIIPAHAGKTSRISSMSSSMRDHPRSRGENPLLCARLEPASGSSPLTRGKRPDRLQRREKRGIIPAHAGKTRFTRRDRGGAWDHPRSRGENAIAA